jgi:hypothetical protein
MKQKYENWLNHKAELNTYTTNRNLARGYFKLPVGYCLHHWNELLKKEWPKRYDCWYPEDLVMMKKEDHNTLHHKNKKISDETRKKLSLAGKGKKKLRTPEHNANLAASRVGKHYSKISEAKKGKKNPKLSISKKGLHWCNNGSINKQYRDNPPEGFVKGRII